MGGKGEGKSERVIVGALGGYHKAPPSQPNHKKNLNCAMFREERKTEEPNKHQTKKMN